MLSRRLEEEPMLVARELVEDAMSALADVRDIDRFLIQRPLPGDGGHWLLSRRHDLITSIATSLKVHCDIEEESNTIARQKATQNTNRYSKRLEKKNPQCDRMHSSLFL